MTSLASSQTLVGRRTPLVPSIVSLRNARKRELKQLGSRPAARSIYVNQFKIEYQFQKFLLRHDRSYMMPMADKIRNYFLAATPFKIVIADTLGKIEQECAEKWPQLMIAREYNMEDLKQLQLMKAFIKARMTPKEKYQILMYFYEKAQFYPYDRSHIKDFAWVDVLDVDCKLWNDRPHLELECAIYFDMEEYCLQLLKDRLIRFAYTQKYQFGIMEVIFTRPLPQLVYYLNKPMFNRMMLEYFDFAMNRFGSPYLKQMAPLMRESWEQLHKMPKTIEITDRVVTVTFDKVKRLTGNRIDRLNSLTSSPMPSRIVDKNFGLRANIRRSAVR